MSRSRSRSRVSDVMYDSYRTERTGAAAGDTYFSSYSGSRPSSSYLYGHSYSNYHEGITTQNRLLDKDSYCTTPKLEFISNTDWLHGWLFIWSKWTHWIITIKLDPMVKIKTLNFILQMRPPERDSPGLQSIPLPVVRLQQGEIVTAQTMAPY